MATDEVVTLPVTGDNGARSIQLPEGWLDSALVQARRIGQQIVLDPVVPEAETSTQGDEIAWRYVNGRPVHPSWPPGYFEWLDAARARGEFDHDEVEPLDFRLGDPDDIR